MFRGTFSSENQQAQICRALLALVHREDLWTDEGPTREACWLFDEGGGTISTTEATVLILAFSVWHGGVGGRRAFHTGP